MHLKQILSMVMTDKFSIGSSQLIAHDLTNITKKIQIINLSNILHTKYSLKKEIIKVVA